MNQINNRDLPHEYAALNDSWGLWHSESALFTRWCSEYSEILDIGCGTGRIAIGLCKLGYKKITAIDIDPGMIALANQITPNEYHINYLHADIVDVQLIKKFDIAIFGYNGLMSVIGSNKRKKAIINISNHLHRGGIFIFTTHLGIDDKSSVFFNFWHTRKKEYEDNNISVDCDDFYTLTVEDKGVNIRQFFATDSELHELLYSCGLQVIDTFRRNDRFTEEEHINSATNDCRFWICQKIN